ncbi:TetR/AcrR family transcriptional regulator [Sorangium sp. So ce1335]|uniref:TetR/AcrR family transcriptional regulator n=1 Tax=Sorangium sp. So ce1335 TaxID=3133335 RepID=UPI003F6043D3
MNKSERRQALLRAARTVFSEKGYHEAKVDDIVALAKVAKGTFYLYFPDKRSVFGELVSGLFSRLGGAILRVDPSADVEAQVKHNIRAIVAVLLDDPALTSILLSHAAGLDPAFVKELRAFRQEVKLLLQQSLAEGQRLGIIEPGDTELYATFTIGALKEVLFENALEEQARPRERIVTALYDLLQRGYLRMDAGRAAQGGESGGEGVEAGDEGGRGERDARGARAGRAAAPEDAAAEAPERPRPARGRGARAKAKAKAKAD